MSVASLFCWSSSARDTVTNYEYIVFCFATRKMPSQRFSKIRAYVGGLMGDGDGIDPFHPHLTLRHLFAITRSSTKMAAKSCSPRRSRKIGSSKTAIVAQLLLESRPFVLSQGTERNTDGTLCLNGMIRCGSLNWYDSHRADHLKPGPAVSGETQETVRNLPSRHFQNRVYNNAIPAIESCCSCVGMCLLTRLYAIGARE